MKKQILGIITIGLLLFSCDSNSETNHSDEGQHSHQGDHSHDDHSHSTEVDETMDEETNLIFDGVERGDKILFGHVDIDEKEVNSVDEMMNIFNQNGSFNGKVSVDINEVCQKAGCWINFKRSEDENIMVFFRDHFTIPIEESAGKSAILYGTLVTDTLDVAFQKHLLDDAVEAGQEINQADYDAITEDKIDLSFDCKSILIRK